MAMETAPSPPLRANETKQSTLVRAAEPIDADALIEENERLRNLVVQLSKLVVKNVLEPK